MTTHLRFLHVCERQFAGLPGEDPQQRRCDTCDTVVHNLDAMAPDARAGLLAHAGAEKTTVCVSLSLPPDAAQACRSGAAVGVSSLPDLTPDYIPTAGVAMPAYFEPLRPRRDDPNVQWQSFAADLPAVLAALAAIAPGFTLARSGDDGWQVHDMSIDLGVMIVAEPAGKQTAVGVQIAPPGEVASRRGVLATYGGLAALVLVPLWLLLVFALWLAGLPGLVVGLGATAVAALLVTVMAGFLAVNALGERAQRRAQDRWRAAWHRRFWPALTAQLSETPPYR